MNRTAHEVQTRWLEGQQPYQRTGNEAVKFSDECWSNGLRLDTSTMGALLTAYGNHPLDTDSTAKVKPSVGLH